MKYFILIFITSLVCSCMQTKNSIQPQLIIVDVSKDYEPKEIWLQDIASRLQEEDNPVLMLLKFKG